MKKIIVTILTFALLTTGCAQKSIVHVGDEPSIAVKRYIDAASQAEWETVLPMLSGEALQEMQVGKERVKITQKVISVQTNTEIQTDNFAVINAEVLKSNNYLDTRFNDLASYEFRLQKSGEHWLIYKVFQKELKPTHLKNGTMPVAARERLKTYLELPVTEKKEKDYLFLAGPILAISQKSSSRLLEIQPKTKVLEITPVGVSEKYLVVKVLYAVQIEGYKPAVITAMVDMVDLAGEWKIIRLDIAQNAKE
ncbi:hypothetical protein N752_29690 [Desulforamulus aquiferis]|nr:hypothetical protein [Desulforamulus aquiferis]RYD01477.1 hypothetical protein N752_29690 [Desulforamulus aquiferis]